MDAENNQLFLKFDWIHCRLKAQIRIEQVFGRDSQVVSNNTLKVPIVIVYEIDLASVTTRSSYLNARRQRSFGDPSTSLSARQRMLILIRGAF